MKEKFEKRPKIVHLSTHGCYDEVEKMFFIEIEDENKPWIMKRLYTDEIKDHFANEIKGVELIVLAVCKS